MRYDRFALALALTTSMLVPLAGCPAVIYYPRTGGYDNPQPMISPPYGLNVSPSKVYEMSGSTLFDAGHAVQRYLDQHYPQADLVRIHALMVGTNAKIHRSSAWEFTYRVKIQTLLVEPALLPVISPTPIPTPSVSPSFKAQANVPSTFKYHLLKFVYSGQGQLLAPEEQDDTGDLLSSVDFGQTILLSKAISTALDIGMGVDAPGLDITLRPTVNGGAVYEIDSSVALKPTYDNDTGYTASSTLGSNVGSFSSTGSATKRVQSSYDSGRSNSSSQPASAPSAPPAPRFVRGKYVIDAYSGAILDRPTVL